MDYFGRVLLESDDDEIVAVVVVVVVVVVVDDDDDAFFLLLLASTKHRIIIFGIFAPATPSRLGRFERNAGKKQPTGFGCWLFLVRWW